MFRRLGFLLVLSACGSPDDGGSASGLCSDDLTVCASDEVCVEFFDPATGDVQSASCDARPTSCVGDDLCAFEGPCATDLGANCAAGTADVCVEYEDGLLVGCAV